MRSGKREIGCRRRDGFTRVDSEYYHSVLLVGDAGRADMGFVLAGAGRS